MSDQTLPTVRLLPGQRQYVEAPTGQTISVAKFPAKNGKPAYVRLDASGTWIDPMPDPDPDPEPDPTWPPVPAGFTTIQRALDTATGPFSVPAGTYRETVTITKPGQVVWFRPGAIIDGDGIRPYALVQNADGATIRGELEVRNCFPPLQDGAVRILRPTTITGIDRRPALHIHDIQRGAGITVRDHARSTLEDLYIHHCGQAGYHGTNVSDQFWRRWHIHDTNTDRVDPGWEAGVGKVSRTRNLVQEDFDVHDVWGHGIWADIDNRGWVVRRSRIRNVTHSGIFFEISEGATIEDNVIVNCGHGGASWAYGAGVQISSSMNAVVRRNLVAWCSRGLAVIAQARGAYPVSDPGDYRDIRLEDNVIVDADGAWLASWVDDRDGGPLFSAAGNAGARNRYWSARPEPVGSRFEWGGIKNVSSGSKTTLAQFNATPGEEGGRYLTDDEKNAILINANVPTTPPTGAT